MDILLWFFVVANLKHFLTLTNWWWSTTQKKWQIIHENVVRTPNNRSHAIQSIFHFKSQALMNASFLSGVFFAWNNQSSCQLKLYSFQSYLKLLFYSHFCKSFRHDTKLIGRKISAAAVTVYEFSQLLSPVNTWRVKINLQRWKWPHFLYCQTCFMYNEITIKMSSLLTLWCHSSTGFPCSYRSRV